MTGNLVGPMATAESGGTMLSMKRRAALQKGGACCPSRLLQSPRRALPTSTFKRQHVIQRRRQAGAPGGGRGAQGHSMVGLPSLVSVVIATWGTREPEGLLQERRGPRHAPPGACSRPCVRHYSEATSCSCLADGQGPASQSRSPPPPAAATP